MMMNGWNMGGAGWFWLLGGILLLIGVIILIVWAVSTLSRTGRTPTQDPSRSTPSEILRERFARGEITEQEFEQARKILGPDR
jgi:putative membrane protein